MKLHMSQYFSLLLYLDYGNFVIIFIYLLVQFCAAICVTSTGLEKNLRIFSCSIYKQNCINKKNTQILNLYFDLPQEPIVMTTSQANERIFQALV